MVHLDFMAKLLGQIANTIVENSYSDLLKQVGWNCCLCYFTVPEVATVASLFQFVTEMGTSGFGSCFGQVVRLYAFAHKLGKPLFQQVTDKVMMCW